MALQIQEIPVDLIDDPQDPMRDKLNEDSIYELLQSIREVGLLQPVTLRLVGGRYEVVAGHRRVAAYRMGAIPTIAGIIRAFDAIEGDVAKVHENLYREDVNPADEGKFLALLRNKHGKTISEIASSIKKSESYVRSRLGVLDLPDYMQTYIRSGTLGLSVAHWLVRISNERVRREYTEYAVRQGINALYAKAWYESFERGALAYNPADQPPPPEGESQTSTEPDIECIICGAETPLSEHLLGYFHGGCAEQIKRIRMEHEAAANEPN